MIGSPKLSSLKTAVAVLATFLVAIGVLPTPVSAAARTGAAKPHVVFLISEDPDNYEAHKTIPPFAETIQASHGFKVTVLKGEGELASFRFRGLADALAQADVLVFFCRRIALSPEQLNAIKGYLTAGKPLVALRTANHGFTVRGKVPEGFKDWPEFVADILGCENRGYGSIKDGVDVSVVPGAAGHPILKGLPATWRSTSNVYHVAPLLDKTATVLLNGKVPKGIEPIAWTRTAGRSRIFYTSLGHPSDFGTPQFRTLLVNGIRWALDAKAP